MSEADSIRDLPKPATVATLACDLRTLGVSPGQVVLVHSSLSALGWVCGGAHAVVLALEEVVGNTGTVVMPAFSAHLSDPAAWSNPPVPEGWWPTIRAAMPPFDPSRTATRTMGRIVDCFRGHPDVRRSDHPQYSFVARGPHAAKVIDGHALADGLGESSPLARLYELDAQVLLLGVGHERNSSLHLAECRTAWKGKVAEKTGAPSASGWREFEQQHTDGDDFAELGAAFANQTIGRVAQAKARLFSQRAAVDFAIAWLPRHR